MASPIPLLDPVIRYDCMFGISGVVQEAMRVIVIPFCFQVVRRMPAEQYAELILVRKPSRFDCTLGFQILTVIEEYYEMLNPCECPTHAGPIAVFCASRIHTTIVGGNETHAKGSNVPVIMLPFSACCYLRCILLIYQLTHVLGTLL